MIDRYLTLKQLAELFSVKESTIRVWVHRGRPDLPHIKLNSRLLFPEKKLERWLAEKEAERKRRNFEI